MCNFVIVYSCVLNRPGSVMVDFSFETTTQELDLKSANSKLTASLSGKYNVKGIGLSGKGIFQFQLAIICIIKIFIY